MTFWKLFFPLGLGVFLFYLLNPFGTATLDPRARIFGIIPYSIPSTSMSPTLREGDYILVKTFSYANNLPKVGDIIVFKAPHQRIDFVKRVVATAGDTISVFNGVVTLNENQLEEEYIQLGPRHNESMDFKEVVVPEKSVFVLGDNRNNSLDSRRFGFIDNNSIVGKVFYIWMSNDIDRIGKI